MLLLRHMQLAKLGYLTPVKLPRLFYQLMAKGQWMQDGSVNQRI